MHATPLTVVQVANRKNFCRDGYVLYNPDLAAFEKRGGDAARHFAEHGEREGRKQVSRDFLDGRDEYFRQKYQLFRDAIALERGISFLRGSGQFPIAAAGRHFDLSDYSAQSENPGFGPFAEEIAANPDKRYLDLGCGFRSQLYPNCLYVEVYPSLTADVIVPPTCSYPLRSECFDGIGCFAVLEHVTEPWAVVAEIHRMLRPGGRCFIDWPFLQPVHGYPSHYYNATRHGLERIFADKFDIEACRTEPFQTPDFTISWVLGKFVRELPVKKQDLIKGMTVGDLIVQPPNGEFWRAILHGLPDQLVSEFACGNTLIATKRFRP